MKKTPKGEPSKASVSNLRQVWAENREEFLRFYAEENVKKIGSHDLEYAYTDTNGKAYFRFGKDFSLPMDRLGRLYYFTELLFKGLSPEEDEKIDRAINNALEAGLGNPKVKSAAKIGSLLIEREKRRSMVIHSELLYNILAVQLVREDEDPSLYVNAIQMQKVEQLRMDYERNGAYPFFQMEELRQLRSFLKLSKDELEAFWTESLLQQQVLMEALETVYTSESVYAKLAKNTQPES